MLDDLCRDPTVSGFDFGLGDAQYKRAFADQALLEETLWVFGTGARATTVNLAVALTNAAKRVQHRLAGLRQQGGRLGRAT
jgi:CelD/BcsL family acetyltransferase involved in cellulose biosynthesis